MSRMLLMVALLIILPACASLEEKVSTGVQLYCIKSIDERSVIRSYVNATIAPNAIKITCEGDESHE